MFTNTSFLRIAGLSAIIAALAYVASIGMTIAAGGGGSPLAFVAIIINALLSVLVYVALYLTHRGESPALSLIAVVTAVVGTLGGLLIDPSTITPVVGVVSALYGIGALVFGWLGVRSASVPRVAGIAAMVAGVIGVAMAVMAFAGVDAQTFGMVNLLGTVAYVVWFVALGVRWLRAPASQGEMQRA